MITIFINNKPIYLTDKLLNLCRENVYDFDQIDLEEQLRALENNRINALCLQGDSPEELWHKFKQHFVLIDAAGGIVKNDADKLLFIFRNGKWDLPKGKVDLGEEVETAALREVEEECGIRKLEITNELAQTFHIYFHKGAYVLKTTHWYLMRTSDMSQPIPQLEEGITQVEWIPHKDIAKMLNNTYGNIKKLFDDHSEQIFTS